MLCIKSTKSLGTAKSRLRPIQREALHKYRVRNVPSPKEVIKKKLEAHGLEIYPLSWLGCRRNKTTRLLPPPWPSHPTQFWAGSSSAVGQPRTASATAQFSNPGSFHRLVPYTFSSHYTWITQRGSKPHVSLHQFLLLSLRGVCGLSRTSQPKQAPCLFLSE